MEENTKVKIVLNDNNEVINISLFDDSNLIPTIPDQYEEILSYVKEHHSEMLDSSDIEQKILNYIDEQKNIIKEEENKLIIDYRENNPIVMNKPEIGYFYDENKKCFIPPKPDDTYILNEVTFKWEPDPNIKYNLHNDGVLYRYSKQMNGWIPVEDNNEEKEQI